MLFNSYQFIFFYLPVVLVGFFWLARSNPGVGALWLAVASIFFYGWWNPKFVILLLASIVFNYIAGRQIGQARLAGKSRPIMLVAIVSNLVLLGVFKYANFFIAVANNGGAQIGLLELTLPIGISFFTFTQIAFLVDAHRGIAREYNFVHYLLFVTWFPHLIAGPVLHHKQMMPQFALPSTYLPNAESMSVGLTLFALGLFKKVVLADQFSLYANPIFDAVSLGSQPMLVEAWIGALAYALQLYFDFSGYSDMAIGLSRLFNIKLPLNFNSPYKAGNVIDFWRRWHMTLSAFLRDYLYVTLGGNRKGQIRRRINLMVTMLLGGLWHGAGWNFVIWGGLHGIYLTINHGWQMLTKRKRSTGGRLTRMISVLLTFTVVVIAWVPFRSPEFDATKAIWAGMAGFNGISVNPIFFPHVLETFGITVSVAGFTPLTGIPIKDVAIWLATGLTIVWFLPNTQQWLVNFCPASDPVIGHSRFAWRQSRINAVVVGILLCISLLSLNRVSEFLYFQF